MDNRTVEFIQSDIFLKLMLKSIAERGNSIADARIQKEICSPGSLPGEAGEEREAKEEIQKQQF